MNITIHFHGLESTEAIKAYVEEKMQMLVKYDESIQSIDVHVKLETHHHQKGEIFSCQALVVSAHGTVTIEKQEEELYKAVDKVKDHLQEMLVSQKEKDRDHRA